MFGGPFLLYDNVSHIIPLKQPFYLVVIYYGFMLIDGFTGTLKYSIDSKKTYDISGVATRNYLGLTTKDFSVNGVFNFSDQERRGAGFDIAG